MKTTDVNLLKPQLTQVSLSKGELNDESFVINFGRLELDYFSIEFGDDEHPLYLVEENEYIIHRV